MVSKLYKNFYELYKCFINPYKLFTYLYKPYKLFYKSYKLSYKLFLMVIDFYKWFNDLLTDFFYKHLKTVSRLYKLLYKPLNKWFIYSYK